MTEALADPEVRGAEAMKARIEALASTMAALVEQAAAVAHATLGVLWWARPKKRARGAPLRAKRLRRAERARDRKAWLVLTRAACRAGIRWEAFSGHVLSAIARMLAGT